MAKYMDGSSERMWGGRHLMMIRGGYMRGV